MFFVFPALIGAGLQTYKWMDEQADLEVEIFFTYFRAIAYNCKDE